MKRISAYIIILTLVALSQAQAQEIGLNLGGGLTGLSAKMETGESKTRPGFRIGADYMHFLNPNFALASGLSLDFYNSKVNIDNLNDSYETNDGEENFEFKTAIKNLEEKISAIYLTIPLMAYYFHPIDKYTLYAGGGFKIGIPLSAKYKTDIAQITNSGYYPSTNQELREPLFAGFGTFNDLSDNGEIKLKPAFMLALEIGMKWDKLLGEKRNLYTALYLDLGLNNISPKADSHLINYNAQEPTDFKIGSALRAETPENLVKSTRLISFGLKIRTNL